jgi:hypothetical protein
MKRQAQLLREQGFSPRSWNASEKRNSDKTMTVSFSTGWLNRMNPETMRFEEIDFSVEKTISGFVVSGAPYRFVAPLFADGQIVFENNTVYDPEQKKILHDDPLKKVKKFSNALHVAGVEKDDGILYEGAFPEIHADLFLRWHEDFVQNLVIFREKPDGTDDIEIPFVQSYGSSVIIKRRVTATEVRGGNERDVGEGIVATLIGSSRKLGTREAAAWDSSGKRCKILLISSTIGGKIYMRKVIPREFLENAVYPVFTDTTDNFTANTADGEISTGGHAAWADARNDTNGDSVGAGGTTNICGAAFQGGSTYGIFRYFVYWDTSALDDGSVFSAASVSVRYPSGATHARTMYWIKNRAGTSLATTDFDDVGATGIGDGDNYGSFSRGGSDGANTDYPSSLSAAFLSNEISVSGNTFLALVDANDRNNISPLNANWTGMEINSADNAGVKPVLSITYEVFSDIVPANLAAAPVSGTPSSMALSWDDVAGETSYSSERSLNGTTGWTEVLTPSADATTATDTGLSADTTYYYRIRGYSSTLVEYTQYSSTANGTTAPGTPISAAAVGLDATTTIRVTWDDIASTETSYVVERSDNGSSGWASISGALDSGIESYDDDVTTASTTKYYRVKAVRSGVDSGYSDVVSGKTAPTAPSSCAVAPVTASYTLRVTWSDDSSDESGFSIERSDNGSTGWAEVGTVGAGVETYDDESVGTGDTIRYYRVRALRSSDGVDSAYSNTDSDTTAPQAPSALAAAFSNLEATITWTDNSTTNNSYLLERKRESAAYATVTSAITANAVSYADTTELDINKTYTYRLSAFRTADSMYSPVATVSAPVPPEEPTNLQAFPDGDVTGNINVKLMWDKQSRYETGTKIERSTNGTDWSTVATTAKGATTYTDTGLTVNTLYYYRVSAVGSVATSTTTSTTVTTRMNTAAGLLFPFLHKVRNFPRE